MAKFFKVTKTGGIPKSFQREVKRRARAAATVAGRAVAKGIQEDVQKRIPRGEKWLDIYRDAIKYLENEEGNEWAVAGLSRVTKLTMVPAESSQIMFFGKEPVSRVMEKYGPWTVDMIPSISGGHRGYAVVRVASSGEVDAHRNRLREIFPTIKSQLEGKGATLLDDPFTRLAEGTYFYDLVFLQMRLEHGLGGFPRVPHWLKTARAAKNQAPAWVADARGEIKRALAGGRPEDAEERLDPVLKKRLEKLRDESWL